MTFVSIVATVRRTLPRQVVADLALLSATFIWGSTFVMVKDAVAAYPVFSFLALRFTFAALAFVPLALLRRPRLSPAAAWTLEPPAPGALRPLPISQARGGLVRYGPPLLVGITLFAGYAFQTAGLQLSTPAKTGFITGLYVVIVPLVAALWLRRSPGAAAWLGITLAAVGLALLAWRPGTRMAAGDLLVVGCAFAFAAQILLVGHFAPRVDAFWLTLGQVLTVILLSGIVALFFEVRPPLTFGVVFAAAFTGVLATTAAFGIQSVAQRFTSVTHAALIFSAEPVFAALASFVLIGETLAPWQLAGCAMILGGGLVAELRRSLA